jgi:2-polyprenyl-6-methoxyphenol hydroxylase-like FAD-dependent oxidoreductase/peroxiredoxin
MSDTEEPSHKTQVAVIGAGILGLMNALQCAKRGFNVTLIDNIVHQKRSFKVGESLLIFSNPFLRTVGQIDDFVQSSYPKAGVWFVYGMEGRENFEGLTEWAFQSKIPKRMQEHIENQKFYRSFFFDAQLVRPETEDLLREHVRATPNIRFLDSAKVRDIKLAEDGAFHHVLTWNSATTNEQGRVQARWIIDCSGRNRLLAKSLKHAAEAREMDDGFQTTAVWAQFDHIEDDLFGDAWVYEFHDGDRTSRDACTAHLWGDGYWIWVIRLSGKRISIGATWDRRKAPPGQTPKEQFWNLINRYPLLRRALKEEHLLEFQMYAKVQYMTDTFVSEKRYGMVGDAASIIDAYYSQGISLGLVTSWHIANIMESDFRQGTLDRDYIAQVNRATRQDWHMMRNMVVEKYTSAIQDPRFFILSHFMDFTVFSSLLAPRWQLVRWLVDTEGDPSRETPWHKEVRGRLKKTLYMSQTPPWTMLSPETVQKLQRRFQAGIAERARWRLENGVQLPEIKAVARADSWLPNLFSTISSKQKVKDISPPRLNMPDNMLFTGKERLPMPFRFNGAIVLGSFLAMYAYDAAETAVRKALRKVAPGRPSTETPSRQRPTAEPPWGEGLKKGDPMPDVAVQADDGSARRLSDYWREKPTAFVFLRHFACAQCRAELIRLKRDRSLVERLGGHIVLVTMGTAQKTAEFKAALKLDFPLVADPDERAYAACGLHTQSRIEAIKATLGGDAGLLLKLNVKGEYGKLVVGGDTYRLGGTVVVDRDGRLAYVFRNRSTAGAAPFDEVLDAFRAIAGFVDRVSPATGEATAVPEVMMGSKSPTTALS